jgi:DNA-binding SARP family transcriptional activator
MLRSHLESIVLEEMGETAMRQQRRRAGRLLERAGAFDEALEAYCRAEDWASAGRLLGLRGEGLVANPGWWVDLVPASLIEDDPWVRLAVARRHRASGRWHSAVEAYRRAEAVFTGAGAERMCQRERIAVACWAGASPVPGAGWSATLRSATQRDPLAVCEHATAASSHQDLLVAALAALLAGDARTASRRLTPLSGSPPLSRAERLSARLATAVAALLAGDAAPLTIWEEVADEAEGAQLPWLAGLARAGAGALLGQPPAPAAAAGMREDAWGTALLTLLSGWCAAGRGGGDPDELDRAAGTLEQLAAPVLEVWARALAGLIRVRQNPASARSGVRRTEARARALRVPGARALALLALAELEPAARHRDAARSISDQCGLALPCLSRTGPRGAPAPSSVRAAAPLAVATFGGFILQRGGRRIDLRAARPKVRSLLRLLVLNSQRPLHREVIVEALWPEADPTAATHSLQVAVSSLRGVLDGAGLDARIGRDADAYRLILPPATLIDTVVFEQSAASARAQRAAGEERRALRDLARAMAIYRGELLPEEGPADWVVAERDRYRAIAHDVALGLATLHRDRGDTVLAIAACEQGLRIDRYRDDLWRLLIATHDDAGDGAAAARARRRYLEVLAELDLGG